MELAFEKQRHFIDDDFVPGGGVLSDALLGERAHARMDDRLELFSRRRIVENRRAELLPVESAVGLQHFGAECFDDFFPGVALGLDDFPRQRVGVDDRRAEAREDFRDRSFSRGDAAGQADQFHATLMAKSAWAFNRWAAKRTRTQ